ncbi:replication protein A 70 kDa DNA-binding subunit B-like [Arachis stenosperma]|uniref:replication protein A 70 kDa DNA-binding subunit B-like n=1 Tax=Arachis stenosperma TaxID=217475 RepID=UPI0025AD66FB|nr:replication protein A 70 kDa DNA-binding subunit B-like [Arachis stenosperma]XP_057745726.1 replication protein A 70 kDa DNA-binding subunit B-like [Arachis stenosperma]
MSMSQHRGSMNQIVDRVADINPTKLGWNLVVGVVRLYELCSQSNPADVYSLEMVLQDEQGDRIHCSIPKGNIVVFKTLIRENGIYSMRNFIVKGNNNFVKTTGHKYKLNFYMKTCVSRLPSDTFHLNPFSYVPFPEIEAMVGMNRIHLLDFIGQVVGKENAQDMVTKSGQQSKCIALYLEDLEQNRMKCTLYGESVDKVISFMDKPENEPVILVAQLFKPHFYLNEVSVQNSLYASRVFFNPDIPDVVSFKNSLMKQGERASQPISHIDRQPQYSVSHELSAGAFPVKTIEEILNMTTETLCWVVGTIVSIEVGATDWFYASCKTCPRKVKENKDRYFCEYCGKVGFNPPLRYRLNVVITDGTGCVNVIIWNQEAKLIMGKPAGDMRDLSKSESTNSYPKAFDSLLERKFLFKISVGKKNISTLDQVYNVIKISDDVSLIGMYSSQASSAEIEGADPSVSNLLAISGQTDNESDGIGVAVVSLSKDSVMESNSDIGLETPAKSTGVEFVSNSTIMVGMDSPDVQGSSNKTTRRGAGKRKIE